MCISPINVECHSSVPRPFPHGAAPPEGTIPSQTPPNGKKRLGAGFRACHRRCHESSATCGTRGTCEVERPGGKRGVRYLRVPFARNSHGDLTAKNFPVTPAAHSLFFEEPAALISRETRCQSRARRKYTGIVHAGRVK